jgi:ATP-dependent Zn protease
VAINDLLTQVDGFAADEENPVFVIAATNYPERVDAAIVRSGRVDIHLPVPPLDRDAREFFLKKYADLCTQYGQELAREDHDMLLRITAGMTGADMENVLREVRLALFRQGGVVAKANITIAMLLEEQIQARKYGGRSARNRSEESLSRTAFHEAGHAIVLAKLNPEIAISHISIVQRGQFGGMVVPDPEQSTERIWTRHEVVDEIAVCVAGLAAERIMLKGGHSSGVSNDLEMATKAARQAVCEWGMDDTLGFVHRQSHGRRNVNGNSNMVTAIADNAIATDAAVIEAIKRLIDEGFKRAEFVIQKNRSLIVKIHDELMRKEEISGDDFKNLLNAR